MYGLGEVALGEQEEGLGTTGVELPETLLTLLTSMDDQIRAGSAFALGHAILGSPDDLLGPVVAGLESADSAGVYAIVSALDHMFVAAAANGASLSASASLAPTLASLFDHLFTASASLDGGETGTRDKIASVLGHFGRDDASVATKLQGQLESSAESNVVTALTALCKAAGRPAPEHAQAALASVVSHLLEFLMDTRLSVRTSAVASLNFVATYYPRLLSAPDSNLSSILPVLYGLVSPNPDLLESVDRGPFKQTVDHGVPLRVAALEAMSTLLTKLPDKLDLANYIATLVNVGLVDADHSVKILVHRILNQLVTHFPVALLSWLEPLMDQFRADLNARPKAQALQHELQLATELLTSILGLVAAISSQPALSSSRWKSWIKSDVVRGPHAQQYASLSQ